MARPTTSSRTRTSPATSVGRPPTAAAESCTASRRVRAPPKVAPPPGVPYFPSPPDSAFIVAIDLDTRKLDTLGAVKIPKVDYQIRQSAEGFLSITVMNNPLPTTDEWAVLPSGAVAFLRGRDYRIDYHQPDGSWTSSPKVAIRLAATRRRRQAEVRRLGEGREPSLADGRVRRRDDPLGEHVRQGRIPRTSRFPPGYVPQNGLAKNWKLPPDVTFPANYIYSCAAGEEPKIIASTPNSPNAGGSPGAAATPAAERGAREAIGAARGAAPGPAGSSGSTQLPAGMPVVPGGLTLAGAPVPPGGTPSCIPSPIVVSGGVAPPPPTIRELFVVPPDELPDYRPPFIAGAARADADGNLWVRTQPAKPLPGGPVYDVINKQGELSDRLQVPVGYTLVGFGKGKVVYLSMRDPKGIHLARVRLR